MKPGRTLLIAALGLTGFGSAHAQVSSDAFLMAPADPAPALSVNLGSSSLDRILADFSLPIATVADRRLQTFLAVDSGNNLSLLCESGVGVNAVLAGLGEQCLMRELDGDRLGGFAEFSVRQQLLLSETHGFDLSFGLSWLQPGLQAGIDEPGLDLFSERFAPSAGLLADAKGQSLSLEGTRWLGERSWLRVTGSTGRYRLDSPLPELAGRWQRSSLGIQAGYGAFAGALVGHRTDTGNNRRAWFDVDLGLSWRTPWSGKVTVGARNLLNHPAEVPAAPVNGKPAAMEESRTPYVRYQQDL